LISAKLDCGAPLLDTSGVEYAAAVRACPSTIIVTDATQPGNPVIFVNPAFTELTGYSPDEAVGRNCRFLQGPKTDPQVVAKIGLALAKGLPFRAEILNYRKDGTTFWNDLAINPVVDGSGRITSFVASQSDITAAKEAQAKSLDAQAQIASIVSNMPGYVFRRVVQQDGAVKYQNSLFDLVDFSGDFAPYSAESRGQIVHPDDREMLRQLVNRSTAEVSPLATEFRVLKANGDVRWFRTYSTPRREAQGDIIWDGVGIDITAEKQSQILLSDIIENIPGYVLKRVRRQNGAIEHPYISSSFGRLIGQAPNVPAKGDNFWANIHPEDRGKIQDSLEQSAKSLSQLVLVYRLSPKNAPERWIRSYSTARQEPNGDVVWDCVAVDITAEKEIEVRLAYLAHHDPLTGLANRAFLTERLSAAIKLSRESDVEIMLSQLLLIDFAEINETLGTDDGDAVLRSAGARMNELSLLQRDAVVARIGDAEFAILRHGATAGAEVGEFVDTLIRNVAQPILIGNDAIAVEPCVGTAAFKKGDLSHLSADAAAREMLKRGTIALSAAAKAGPGAHRIYDKELDHRTRHRMMLRHSLRQAIEQDQFELHYQPLVDMQSGHIVSAEALIRWRHPDLGLLRPDLFISLAEESGQIGALGEWVIRRAMRQVSEWRSLGLTPPKIAVNVSGVQIGLPDFVETIRTALTQTGADASGFELELTEGFLLERSPETLSVLSELKSMGFELVIDDFGAGHSNFQYLRNFPVGKLKIDQIFVRQLVADSNDALIIHAIASMARSLKLGLVAEGIETSLQRDFLREQGCLIGQGYFFSLPLAAEDFAWMIANDVVLPMSPLKRRKPDDPTTKAQS
jgi:PAS domain S-box-containing protein/diguanylate cyclase (GGDEF)-like protein